MTEQEKDLPQDEPLETEVVMEEETTEETQEETKTLTRAEMEKLENLAKEYMELKDKNLRLMAEYDNFRKRTAKEKESIYQDVKCSTVLALLPVYDNLERAVTAETDLESPQRKGMEMMLQQFAELLTKLGVTEMDAFHQPFDPERHNAVMHIEDENLPENTVSMVFQKGFMLGEKVLRFATVQAAN